MEVQRSLFELKPIGTRSGFVFRTQTGWWAMPTQFAHEIRRSVSLVLSDAEVTDVYKALADKWMYVPKTRPLFSSIESEILAAVQLEACRIQRLRNALE